MAVRFQSYHYSNSGKKYEVKIIDEDLVTSTNYAITFGDNSGIAITRSGGSPLKPERIIGTSVEVVMQLVNSNDEDFYSDLVNSHEGRFFIEVNWFHPITDAFTNIFKGHILADISAIEDKFEPAFSISAVDGLGTLENIDYFGDPVPNLEKTYAEHVGRILNALPINVLYDTFQNLFKIAVDLRDENHAVGAKFADTTRVRNYFYEKKDGVKVFASMHDVLHEFLSMINARIYFSEGIFVIDQLGYRGENEIVTYDYYNADRTYDSSAVSRSEINYVTEPTILSDAHPTITSVVPVKDVTVIQSGEFLANLLNGKTWSYLESSSEITTGITNINGVDRIYFNFELKHYISSDRDIILPETIASLPVAWMSLDVTIKIEGTSTNHYYSGKYTDVFYDNAQYPIININAVYSPVPAVVQIRLPISKKKQLSPLYNVEHLLKYIQVNIMTVPLTETGTVSVNIDNFKLWTDDSFTTELTLSPIYAIPPETNEVPFWDVINPVFAVGTTLKSATTLSNRVTTLLNDERNNIPIEEKFSMGVFPNITTSQKIEVFNGTIWVDSTGWKGTNDTTYQRLAVQVIRDILKLRKLPSDKIEISLWDRAASYHSYERLINYKGKKCIWLDWSFTTQDDTIRGTLWELINGTVEDDPTPTTSDVPTSILGLPPGFTTNIPPPFSDENGVTDFVNGDPDQSDYYYEGIMSGDSVTISDYTLFPDNTVYTMASINHSIKVWIGSALYYIVDKLQVNLANTECRLDYATKTIEFKSDISGRLVRIEAIKRYKLIPATV